MVHSATSCQVWGWLDMLQVRTKPRWGFPGTCGTCSILLPHPHSERHKVPWPGPLMPSPELLPCLHLFKLPSLPLGLRLRTTHTRVTVLTLTPSHVAPHPSLPRAACLKTPYIACRLPLLPSWEFSLMWFWGSSSRSQRRGNQLI